MAAPFNVHPGDCLHSQPRRLCTVRLSSARGGRVHLSTIVERMSVSVSAPWNASLTATVTVTEASVTASPPTRRPTAHHRGSPLVSVRTFMNMHFVSDGEEISL